MVRVSPPFDACYEIMPNGCWEWRRATQKRWLYGKYGRRLAHRVSYEIHKGPIPDGMLVCHSCDNPPCVNPDHLWLGTSKDNTHDMFSKGRQGSRRIKGTRNGEANPAAKLRVEDVVEIRRLRGALPQKRLAERFRISASQIAAIHAGRSWAYLNSEGANPQ